MTLKAGRIVALDDPSVGVEIVSLLGPNQKYLEGVSEANPKPMCG